MCTLRRIPADMITKDQSQKLPEKPEMIKYIIHQYWCGTCKEMKEKAILYRYMFAAEIAKFT
jgi:hypothetical protein